MPESRPEISQRHCREWETYRNEILVPARESGDEKTVKTAKTLADAIRITQDGERRAWDFAGGGEVDASMEIAWAGETDGGSGE